MTNLLKYSLVATFLMLAASSVGYARGVHGVPASPPAKAPEIDPGLAISGITLLVGSITVARARQRQS